MSLGREGSVGDNPSMHAAVQALDSAGISVVTSAGNDQYLEVSQNIPAAYPEVLAIASTTAEDGTGPRKGQCAGVMIPADTASFFTTDGVGVAISAPGARRENVKNSCTINSEGILSLKLGGGTTRKSGTSMSSPHTAGVAALLYEAGALNSAAVRSAIAGGADRVGVAPLDSPTYSYSFDGVREGVLSAGGALSTLLP
jgi:subtilisin family serine protease